MYYDWMATRPVELWGFLPFWQQSGRYRKYESLILTWSGQRHFDVMGARFLKKKKKLCAFDARFFSIAATEADCIDP